MAPSIDVLRVAFGLAMVSLVSMTACRPTVVSEAGPYARTASFLGHVARSAEMREELLSNGTSNDLALLQDLFAIAVKFDGRYDAALRSGLFSTDSTAKEEKLAEWTGEEFGGWLARLREKDGVAPGEFVDRSIFSISIAITSNETPERAARSASKEAYLDKKFLDGMRRKMKVLPRRFEEWSG